jgi:hypothetical protein
VRKVKIRYNGIHSKKKGRRMNQTTTFSLGNKVTSKKTGFPAVGTIIGVLDGLFWATNHPSARWDELYPNWFMRPVYYVLYEKPQKHVTYEEFILGREQHAEHPILKMQYQLLPVQNPVVYCEEDLELFE